MRAEVTMGLAWRTTMKSETLNCQTRTKVMSICPICLLNATPALNVCLLNATPALNPLYRVHVTVGFASRSGAVSFEAAGYDLSFYTQALVNSIEAVGHQVDVVQLLEDVRQKVTWQTSTLGALQTPCAYSAKEGRVVLVSLVGSTPLSAVAAVTVGDAVRPLLNHLVPQVWLQWTR